MTIHWQSSNFPIEQSFYKFDELPFLERVCWLRQHVAAESGTVIVFYQTLWSKEGSTFKNVDTQFVNRLNVDFSDCFEIQCTHSFRVKCEIFNNRCFVQFAWFCLFTSLFRSNLQNLKLDFCWHRCRINHLRCGRKGSICMALRL